MNDTTTSKDATAARDAEIARDGWSEIRRDLHGHYWTMSTYVTAVLRMPPAITDRVWRTTVRDPALGEVELTGRLAMPATPTKDLVVVVHGLGGDVESLYVRWGANAVLAAGVACLRVHLRGADASGSDVYHAGLSSDIAAILADPSLVGFERIALLGYSLGGHISLRAAADAGMDPRLRAVAAVCPPLDLKATQLAIERPDRSIYQHYMLRRLKVGYAAVVRRHGSGSRAAPADLARVNRIRRIYEWDQHVICPRYGFGSPHDYYAKMSVGPMLSRIEIPTLILVAEADPVIPLSTVAPSLGRISAAVQVARTARGGHVGFPSRLDFEGGVLRSGNVDASVVQWLMETW